MDLPTKFFSNTYDTIFSSFNWYKMLMDTDFVIIFTDVYLRMY